jgi:hypothetical protein
MTKNMLALPYLEAWRIQRVPEMTLEDVSEVTGVSMVDLFAAERNQNGLDVEAVRALAKFYRVSPFMLMHLDPRNAVSILRYMNRLHTEIAEALSLYRRLKEPLHDRPADNDNPPLEARSNATCHPAWPKHWITSRVTFRWLGRRLTHRKKCVIRSVESGEGAKFQ